MKKNIFLGVAILFISFTTHAQITITQSDMPSANMNFTEVNDTVCLNIQKGNAGANQTWNLANIANHYLSTTSWVNPATLPGATSFPTANIAQTQSDGIDSYFNKSSTSFVALGTQEDLGVGMGLQTVHFTPPLKYFQFPTTYLTSFNGTYAFDIKVPLDFPPVDSMWLQFSVNYSSIVDGWGNVTTPAYSNIASLRQKNTSINTINTLIHDTITGMWNPAGGAQKDTSYNYIWISNLYKYSLANLQTDVSGNVVYASYLTSSGLGINNTASAINKIDVFPNPANEFININGTPQNTFLLILDSNGRLITKQLLNRYKNKINISGYNDGIYFYHLFDGKGETIDNGKFTVVK